MPNHQVSKNTIQYLQYVAIIGQNEKELALLNVFLETISGFEACENVFYERGLGLCYRIWHGILGIHDWCEFTHGSLTVFIDELCL